MRLIDKVSMVRFRKKIAILFAATGTIGSVAQMLLQLYLTSRGMSVPYLNVDSTEYMLYRIFNGMYFIGIISYVLGGGFSILLKSAKEIGSIGGVIPIFPVNLILKLFVTVIAFLFLFQFPILFVLPDAIMHP